MRLLIDECLSRGVAEELTSAGHDAVHIVDLGLAGSSDIEVAEVARRDNRVLVSADTDFGELILKSGESLPSLILIRRRDHAPRGQAEVIAAVIDRIGPELATGAIAVVDESRIRLREIRPVELGPTD